jgi:hypothetical protein
MGVLSLITLASFAVMLHFHERDEYRIAWRASFAVSAVLWPAYLFELLLAWRAGSPRLRERLWCCVLPPLRLAARDHETGRRVWILGLSWQTVSPELRDRLERIGNVPMIVIACLVLPLIAFEYQYAEQIEGDLRWAGCTAAATTLIWFAFAVEFVVMCSLADRKLEYCRAHWLDLAIILLPLAAFLRVLRLGRLLRLQQLGRTARAFRMRGVMIRAWRALLLLDAVRRILHGRPERQLKRLEELIRLKEHELAELRAEQQHLLGRLSPPPEVPPRSESSRAA